MTRAALSHVTDWIFDLDNTLYPREYNLFAQIDVLITRYVGKATGLPHDAARALQKQFYQKYGTSLRGLMEGYGVDPDAYLKAVHDIDYSCVLPHPELMAAIAALPGRKYIFTNADHGHADAVLTRLGGADLFDGKFDIKDALFVPKPARAAYETFIARFGIDPTRAAMFEDIEKNLVVPHEMGMVTVHVVPGEDYVPVDRDDWELAQADGDQHVHHVTSNLAAFLAG